MNASETRQPDSKSVTNDHFIRADLGTNEALSSEKGLSQDREMMTTN